MTTDATYVIVGARLAGAKAAEALRAEGFDGQVILIGEEAERPYERPPLSKDYLLGKADRETIYVHPEEWYAEHDVDLRLGATVTGVDPGRTRVSLADGSRVSYAKLLLATGSRAAPAAGAGHRPGRRPLPAQRPGQRPDQGDFRTAARIVVIGGGWIGLEAAAAARAAGVEVTVLEASELPLLRVLGREVAQVFADLHREHGVDLRSTSHPEITGQSGQPRVSASPTAALSRPTRSSSAWASAQQPPRRGGGPRGRQRRPGDARCDPADPDIFAAGDVANALHPLLGQHIRVEHWANALNQPQAAPRPCSARTPPTTSCRTSSPTSTTWAWSTPATSGPTATPRSSSAGTPTRASTSRSGWPRGRVLAGMNVNIWDVNDAIQDLVRSGRPSDPGALADAATPLKSLA